MTHRTMIHCTMGSGAREGGRFPSAVAFRNVNIPELPWESETCACRMHRGHGRLFPRPPFTPPLAPALRSSGGWSFGTALRRECERKLGSGADCVPRSTRAARPSGMPSTCGAGAQASCACRVAAPGARAAPRRAPAKERAQGAGVAPAGVTAWRSTTLSSTDAQ